MTITALGQVEFNGLRLDGHYHIQTIEGLRASPEVRSTDLTRLGHHGLHPGTDWLGGRSVVITVAVAPSADVDFDNAIEALAAAFAPAVNTTAQPLTFWLRGVGEGQLARVYARPRRFATVMDVAYNQGVTTFAVELFCTDPLIYSDDEHMLSTTLPTSPDGLEWALDWALNWGGTSAAGSLNVDNRGNFEAPVVLRIDGPVVNPRIENITAGRTLELSITLASGEFIDIDTSARTVLLGGTSSRYFALTDDSQWWNLRPGVNTINFRASTPDVSLLTATWRSAWI